MQVMYTVITYVRMFRLGKFTFYVVLFLTGVLTHSVLYHLIHSVKKEKLDNASRFDYTSKKKIEKSSFTNATSESLEIFVERMSAILMQKLFALTTAEKTQEYVTCINEEVIGNSCGPGGCLRLQLPASVPERVEHLVKPKHLRLSANITAILRYMQEQVIGSYDVIIATAVSSNHFEELKSMISNVRIHLLPYLKNFTFIVYDLGLTEKEASIILNNCNCHVIRFPFEKLAPFLSYRKCYTWKPIIVNAHISQTNLLLWADASIRFYPNVEHTFRLLNRTRERGLQVGWSPNSIAYTTLQSMFHFYGDEACAYLPYMSSLNAIIVVYNEEFVRRVVLEPWAACAVDGRCMCPEDVKNLLQIRISCHKHKGKFDYGICHRFDQSALSIIGTKLYQSATKYIFLENIRSYVDIRRGDKTIESGSAFHSRNVSSK